VPVGYEVARALRVPLDVWVVRKLGLPQQPELAMGAIASGGTRVLNRSVLEAIGPDAMEIFERVAERELAELQQRELKYRGARPSPELRNRIVILVDDGLATGSTMRAAAQAVRQHGPAKLIIAVPVAAESSCAELETEADEIICASTPEPFFGVGQFYEDFSQTTDEEVRRCLEE
jgi:putative phosphoribosyl transferase